MSQGFYLASWVDVWPIGTDGFIVAGKALLVIRVDGGQLTMPWCLPEVGFFRNSFIL